MSEMTMDQFERLDTKLDHILAEAAEARTEAALIAHRTGQMEAHLARLNGRVGDTEKRTDALERLDIERRGAWKVICAVAAAVGSVVGSVMMWLLGRGVK